MTLDPIVEILIKSSLLVALGLGLRALVKKEKPALRHLVLLVTIVGALAIPIAIPLVKYQTKIPIPQQFDLGLEKPSVGTYPVGQNTAPQDAAVVQVKAQVPWQAYALGIWFAGFTFIIARYSLGLAALAKLRRNQSKPADKSIEQSPTIQCDLRISTTPSPKTAMTWGLFRPTILLPMDSSNWTPHRMEMILLHELAHVRRKDFVSQLLTEIACALYWFNPLVWQSAHAMRDDAELAADDAVLQSGIRPTDYATELLQLAANLSKGNLVLNRVGISTMTNSKIESRLTAILSSTARSSSAKFRGITTVSALAALALSGVAVTTVASLKLHQDASPAQLKTEAMSRMKQLALATHIYAVDHDDRMPSATSTKNAEEIIQPYAKNREVFKSPRPGAKFLYNLNISAVEWKMIPLPAESVVWFEVTPKGLDPHASYADGHVKTITPENFKAFEKALKQKFPRSGAYVNLPLSGLGG